MANNPVIARHLEETGGFSDKEVPVLITSGESLTPFFVNTEKLCRDPDITNFLKEKGNESKVVVEHAIELMAKHPEFRQDIEIIAEKVKSLYEMEGSWAVAGGQTRDWIFSGPVAKLLGVPHISLYKPSAGDRAEVIWPSGEVSDYTNQKMPFNSVHVVDLITKASSVYSKKGDEEIGWIPMQRKREAEVNKVVAVVSRKQGGEERLAGLEKPVEAHYMVAIDRDYLTDHSKQADIAIEYVEDETKWTQKYITENGISILVPYFEDNPKKLPRAKQFLYIYENWLKESGNLAALDKAVQQQYGKTIDKIVGDKK